MKLTESRESASLLGLDRADMERLAEELGEPRYRGRQLFNGIYSHWSLNLEGMTDLSRRFRDSVLLHYQPAAPSIRERYESRDGSARYVLEFPDGQAVESVYMPEENRATLCISSQVGCAVDCRFCFTAFMGLQRNLTVGEILGQVYALVQAHGLGPGLRLNVVFMGMGEPLLNYDAVMKAFRIMSDPHGMAIPWRRITLSTSGVIPGIERLAEERLRPKLAISLNASNAGQRASLMPLSLKYELDQLIAACRAYPLRRRERLTFEYVLIDGINDSPDDALAVAGLLRGMQAKVNLIPFNPGDDLPYRASPFGRILAFQDVLAREQVPAFIRISRGQDVRAACGQLMLRK
jgi:23S rRNA (adenine2503-C2)-methyltransferase